MRTRRRWVHLVNHTRVSHSSARALLVFTRTTRLRMKHRSTLESRTQSLKRTWRWRTLCWSLSSSSWSSRYLSASAVAFSFAPSNVDTIRAWIWAIVTCKNVRGDQANKCAGRGTIRWTSRCSKRRCRTGRWTIRRTHRCIKSRCRIIPATWRLVLSVTERRP